MFDFYTHLFYAFYCCAFNQSVGMWNKKLTLKETWTHNPYHESLQWHVEKYLLPWLLKHEQKYLDIKKQQKDEDIS